MFFKDNYGFSLKPGDFVIRRKKCADVDHFKCHPFSFGVIYDFVVENFETRPDVERDMGEPRNLCWIETQVKPFDINMIPKGEEIIQWSPVECIKINQFSYFMLKLMWPVIRLFYRTPLVGQSTDR